jgi:DNA-directed RNA polymerase beta subunit|tara:strand:- start:14 stop:226 length:213 start_codon:yes stop_codon:yes gene_type:complete
VPGGEEIGGNSSEEGKTMATSKMDNMTCRSKECVGKPLQVVATQLPYVFRYLANELFAMNIRMNLTVSST